MADQSLENAVFQAIEGQGKNSQKIREKYDSFDDLQKDEFLNKAAGKLGIQPDSPREDKTIEIQDPDKPVSLAEKFGRGPVAGAMETAIRSPVGRFAAGALQEAGEVIADIPRGTETFVRSFPGIVAGPRKEGEGFLDKVSREFGEAEKRSILPGKEELVGGAVGLGAQFLGEGRDAFTLAKDKEEIGRQFLGAGKEIGEEVDFELGEAGDLGALTADIAVIAPSAVAFLRGIGNFGGKATRLIPKIERTLKGWVQSRGKGIDLSKRTIDAMIDQLYRVKELGGKAEEGMFKVARTLGEKVQKYRLLRNRNYKADMRQALQTFGKAKVETNAKNSSIIDELMDISGDQLVPRTFQKWAENAVKDLRGKKTIDLSKMAQLRREAMNKFAQFKSGGEGLDRVRVSAASARRLSEKMNKAMNRAVSRYAESNNIPINEVSTVQKVNNDYHQASIMLTNMSKVVGKQRRVLEVGDRGKKLVRDFPDAEHGIRSTTLKGNEAHAQVLDNFAREFPESASHINELRMFMASDDIITKTAGGTGITAAGGRSGAPSAIVRTGAQQITQEIPFELSKGILSAIQRSRATPLSTVGRRVVGGGATAFPALDRTFVPGRRN